MTDPIPTPQAPPQGLAPNYIDPEHTGEDRKLLKAFYLACQAEGGTADEITLRGIRATIAAHEAARPAPAPVPTFLDAIRLANGCHDYSGGYMCEAAEVYHAGITTVVNVLRKAAIGPWDSQTNAVFAMGSACLNTPAPTTEEVEARFRAWWAESYPHAPVGNHAVASHVAFALHLLREAMP